MGAHRDHRATRGAPLAEIRVRTCVGVASAVTRTSTSTVAECAEGRAARGERCAAISARAVAALHGSAYRGWGEGVKGRFLAAPGGERRLPRTVRHFSGAARGELALRDLSYAA